MPKARQLRPRSLFAGDYESEDSAAPSPAPGPRPEAQRASQVRRDILVHAGYKPPRDGHKCERCDSARGSGQLICSGCATFLCPLCCLGPKCDGVVCDECQTSVCWQCASAPTVLAKLNASLCSACPAVTEAWRMGFWQEFLRAHIVAIEADGRASHDSAFPSLPNDSTAANSPCRPPRPNARHTPRETEETVALLCEEDSLGDVDGREGCADAVACSRTAEGPTVWAVAAQAPGAGCAPDSQAAEEDQIVRSILSGAGTVPSAAHVMCLLRDARESWVFAASPAARMMSAQSARSSSGATSPGLLQMMQAMGTRWMSAGPSAHSNSLAPDSSSPTQYGRRLSRGLVRSAKGPPPDIPRSGSLSLIGASAMRAADGAGTARNPAFAHPERGAMGHDGRGTGSWGDLAALHPATSTGDAGGSGQAADEELWGGGVAWDQGPRSQPTGVTLAWGAVPPMADASAFMYGDGLPDRPTSAGTGVLRTVRDGRATLELVPESPSGDKDGILATHSAQGAFRSHLAYAWGRAEGDGAPRQSPGVRKSRSVTWETGRGGAREVGAGLRVLPPMSAASSRPKSAGLPGHGTKRLMALSQSPGGSLEQEGGRAGGGWSSMDGADGPGGATSSAGKRFRPSAS